MAKGFHLSWAHRYRRKYTWTEKWNNAIDFAAALPNLPLATGHDISRRGRQDPMGLPAGTPLCVADWCKVMFGCGLGGAFGLDGGSIARLTEANDAGVSSELMTDLFLREALKDW